MKALLWGFIAFLIAWLMVACTRTVYVPMERTSHDTAHRSALRADSVHVHDLILLWAHTEGDTVYRDKVITRYEYRYKLRTDTLLAVRADTIAVPAATAAPMGWWERARLRLFAPLALAAALLALAVAWLWGRR